MILFRKVKEIIIKKHKNICMFVFTCTRMRGPPSSAARRAVVPLYFRGGRRQPSAYCPPRRLRALTTPSSPVYTTERSAVHTGVRTPNGRRGRGGEFPHPSPRQQNKQRANIPLGVEAHARACCCRCRATDNFKTVQLDSIYYTGNALKILSR